MPKFYRLAGLLALLLVLTGCGGGAPIQIEVLANAGAADYLEAAAVAFNDADARTADGARVSVTVSTLEAGEAVVALLEGETRPALWIPDDPVWAAALAREGVAAYRSDCQSVAQSPLVIGLWREVAGLFGWPGRSLGWLDIGSLANDPTAWDYYSGGQYGAAFRLGHTHPGLSGSGASTLLALVQAAETKTEPVTVADIEQPIVRASVGAFESGVSWFSSDTETLGATMAERGPSYLGAGVMYENTVLSEGRGALVPIYPFEGTFVATHPACVDGDADDATQAAAQTFRDWLRDADGQALAVSYGLRPVAAATDTTTLSQFEGVDLTQPARVFGAPSVDTLYAVQALWQAARKPVHLTMLLDTSGSMRGEKMDNMLLAAVEFVRQMGDNDYLSLVEFYTEPVVRAEYQRVGDERSALIAIIEEMQPGGDTALYDAVGLGGDVLARRASASTASALVVLSDGQDTSSVRFRLDEALFAHAAANGTTVFTIAYGRDADDDVLRQMAERANGQFYSGDVASIAAIYEEMSAAFGGSAGIGR